MHKFLIFLFLVVPSFAQYSSLSGYCEQGGNVVITSGFASSTLAQQSFPSCMVSVFNDGTSTPSTIYSTSTGSPQANPFVAAPQGYWSFYAASGNYLLTFSGAGILVPFSRQFSIGGSGGGGSSFLTNGVSNSTQTGLNLISSAATDGLTLTFTNTAGSTVQLGFTGRLTSAGMSITGVTAGSYTSSNITVDTSGRVTSAANGSGGITYCPAGICNSTGSAWGTSYTTTGSGTVVALATSPVFITPILGTPTSGNASNLSNLPIVITTTGTSGAATWTQSTNTLNIPQYTGGGGCTAGTGIICTGSTISVDTTLIPTKAAVQAGTSNIATVTSSGTATVTATMNPTLGAYVQDQPLSAVANFTSMGSLNINGLGAKNVYDPTGTTTPITTVSGLSYDFKYLSTLNSGAGGFQCVSANCGSSSSVTFSPPYMVSGGTSYLNYGFAATLPPTTGWTAINCGSGCTFTTSGLNGALSFISAGQALSGVEFYQGEYQAIGSTTTLIVAMDCTDGSTSNSIGISTKARCGIGIVNSSTGAAFTVGFANVSFPAISSSSWSSTTSLAFDTSTSGPLQAGAPMYFKITYTGGAYTPYYSLNGYKWTQVDTRTSLSGFDKWFIYAEGTANSASGLTTSNIYSWSAQ